MTQKFSNPRGTADILPQDIPLWQNIETQARKLVEIYGYREIRTPIFEDSNVFSRSMGETSDVVQKQMLNLAAQVAGEDPLKLSGLSLRPEGTAAVVRSYIQNGLAKTENLSKLFYIGPMFRGERPQKGRLRQFHQIGVEALGSDTSSPYLDAEVLSLSVEMLKAFGLKDFVLKLNTLGSPEDKERFALHLRKMLEPHKSQLSEDSQRRFEKNVFRILDSKNAADKEIVANLNIDHSYLSSESRDYFNKVQETLKELEVPFEVSLDLVRGLDYYTHTVFEITGTSLGSQDALGAGGRYANLVQQLGGPQADAIGFALGIERIILALGDQNKPVASSPELFIIALDDKAFDPAFRLLHQVRQAGIRSDIQYRLSSMKSQMRAANKAGAQYVLIIGDEEVRNKKVSIKNMETSDQVEVGFDLTSILQVIQKS